MSSVIVVGQTHIPYDIRESSKAKKLTINVTPDCVEVVVPSGTEKKAIEDILRKRRRWIYNKRDELLDGLRMVQGVYPENYLSGSKIMYRGRMLRISVRGISGITEPSVTYKTGFYIDVPEGLPEQERKLMVKSVLENWMKSHVLQDCRSFIRKYSEKFSQSPNGVRIKEQKRLWGSCGKDGVLYINWHLIHAPLRILEYVVIHEMVHLKYRNHTEEFWNRLKSLYPTTSDCENWLSKYRIVV